MLEDQYIGQVGVVRDGTSWVARGIEAVTRSPAFHCVVGIGGGLCIGAEPGGARVRSVGYWSAVWTRFDHGQDQAEAIAGFAESKEGAPYGYVDDALLGLQFAAHWAGWSFRWPKPVRMSLSSDRSWMCSELADASLRAGGVDAFPYRDACEVAPADFLGLLLERGWVSGSTASRMTLGLG